MHSISAMTYLMILLGILAIAAIVVTVLGLRSDGYRRTPTATISRQADPGQWH